MRINLVTGRTLGQGEGLEKGKGSKEYFDNVATVFLSEEDIEKLGLEEDSSVKISTEAGTSVVNYEEDDLEPGMAFMPLGPWASLLLSVDTSGTGIFQSKSIEAEVVETDEKVPSLEEIAKSLEES